MLAPLFALSLLSCTVDKQSGDSADSYASDDASIINREMKEVAMEFSADDSSTFEINKFIYGTFIEHIETCIYNGIWSETIMDRKFYSPIGKEVSQWNVVSGAIAMDTSSPFEGEYSPILAKDDSIKQIGISLDKKDYTGYLYAKGSGKLELKFTINGEEIVKDITVDSSDYQKYSYSLTSPSQSKKVTLKITSLGGPVTFDSISLMPSDNYYGMRKETLNKLKQLNATFYRWPGGNFVSGYDFYDGIGDRDKRPTRRNLNYIGQESDFDSEAERIASDIIKIGSLGFYGAFEPNDFGLDEFIQMCRYLEAEPNIVVNSGLGSADMAKNEVEYCNGTSGKYAAMRPQKESYNVKYFSIGNEMNGDWQLGHTSIGNYVERHNSFAVAMKSVDPNIEIIAVGDNSSSWSQSMVNSCKSNIDYLSEHFYAERKEDNVKEHILSLKNQTANRISNHRNLNGAGNIKIAFDEYAYLDAEVASRLKDGMGVASGLNEMIKNGDVVSIACYSSTVNATQGQVATDDFYAHLEGSGYASSLYRDNLQNHYLPMKYKLSRGDDYYEAILTVNEEKTEVTLAVINTTDNILKFTNSAFKQGIKQDIVQGDFLESSNSVKSQELSRIKRNLSANYAIVEPRSITLTTLKI